MAGRLAGMMDGRPVVIDADDAGLTLSIADVRSAWATRKSVRTLLPVLRGLKFFGVPVRARIAGLLTLEVLPRPSAFVRILMPVLSSLDG